MISFVEQYFLGVGLLCRLMHLPPRIEDKLLSPLGVNAHGLSKQLVLEGKVSCP